MKSSIKMKNNLVRILAATFILLCGIVASSYAAVTQDTVIIELENNTRIIIYTKDVQGLKDLQNYDLNAMLRDLSMSIDSSQSEVQQLVIEDPQGERYLSDTTVVINDEIEVLHGDETPQEITIRLGRYRIITDVNEWDDLEDEVEDWDDVEFKTSVREEEESPANFFSFKLELGTNNYLEEGSFPDNDGAPYAVRPWGSWYIALGWTRTHEVAGPLFFEWGSSFSWYNFKFENEQVNLVKGPETVEFAILPTEIEGKKSKLTVSHINISFVPLLDFSRGKRKVKSLEGPGVRIENYKQQGFRVGLGMYAGYRLGSHTKFRFKENGKTDKVKEHDNFFLNNWRYGLKFRVGIKDLDLFFNYDLNELFSSGRGPELNAFSFGLII